MYVSSVTTCRRDTQTCPISIVEPFPKAWIGQRTNTFSFRVKNVEHISIQLTRLHGIIRREPKRSWFQAFAVSWMLYAFFWVIPWRLNFICRRFGTLCLFHLHRQVGARTYLPMKMEQIVPKRRHIKFSCRGITQKKAFNSRSVIYFQTATFLLV